LLVALVLIVGTWNRKHWLPSGVLSFFSTEVSPLWPG
jgi:hypothetical protein